MLSICSLFYFWQLLKERPRKENDHDEDEDGDNGGSLSLATDGHLDGAAGHGRRSRQTAEETTHQVADTLGKNVGKILSDRLLP